MNYIGQTVESAAVESVAVESTTVVSVAVESFAVPHVVVLLPQEANDTATTAANTNANFFISLCF